MQWNDEVIMGVDLSLSNTGIALFSLKGKPLQILSISTSSKQERGERLREIGEAILDLKNNYNLVEVAVEQGFYRYASSTQSLYQSQGVLLYLLYDIPCYFYAPSTIKKVVTGKGNASKIKVQEVVSEIFPDLVFDDNDQSDAVAVCLAHMIKKGTVRSHL